MNFAELFNDDCNDVSLTDAQVIERAKIYLAEADKKISTLKNIAYNAIVVGEVFERFDNPLDEIGCSQELYDEIAE